ncbi:MAG: twin-arginine translocase TatA/TatE family subunit [Elusimicrobia bacterium]|nr:twin-arginine translocase TatA/TatE family subunit [Elusimicrobiota bacterium]
MFDIGFPELLLILVVALLLFGARRVPEVAKALGQSINAFKSGIREVYREAESTKAEAKKLEEETKT